MRALTWLAACLVLCFGVVEGLAPDTARAEEPTRVIPEYRLGSSDKIRVITFGEQSLSGEFIIGGSGKVAYFEGTPIPTSVFITAVLAWAAWQGTLGAQLWGGAWQLGPWLLHPMSLLFAASGTAMISKTLRIPKF